MLVECPDCHLHYNDEFRWTICPHNTLDRDAGAKPVLYINRKTPGQDGTVRKAHYGDGEQPWDTMVKLGWAPYFAASSIIKYLRRNKDHAHSLESAQWYYERLRESDSVVYQDVRKRLLFTLTQDEHNRLVGSDTTPIISSTPKQRRKTNADLSKTR